VNTALIDLQHQSTKRQEVCTVEPVQLAMALVGSKKTVSSFLQNATHKNQLILTRASRLEFEVPL